MKRLISLWQNYIVINFKNPFRLIREGALSLGGYYRFKDAFIASILFESKNFAIGFSYDINVSDLKLATSKDGGMEITIRYTTPSPFEYRRKGNSLL
ncbi:MAG: type IX secretion system membrane protein PorP/SprF [Bacteroidia bacterium]|nr:type IX secretion system membrane protein PorP/SprF [Bacteroidia bacterium]